MDFPSSPSIAALAADIVASTIPGCSEAELQSLEEQETMVEEAITVVEESIEEVSTNLEGKVPILDQDFIVIICRSNS